MSDYDSPWLGDAVTSPCAECGQHGAHTLEVCAARVQNIRLKELAEAIRAAAERLAAR